MTVQSPFPTALLLCRSLSAQPSFCVFRNEIFLRLIYFKPCQLYSVQYIYLWFLCILINSVFFYCSMVSSDKELGVLCWRDISIFVTVLLVAITNIETELYRGRERRSYIWSTLWRSDYNYTHALNCYFINKIEYISVYMPQWLINWEKKWLFAPTLPC